MLFPAKRRLQLKFFVHHCLYIEVSLLSFSKREFHLVACAFEKKLLSTYSRPFITSVDLENSGEHEISDLSTDLRLSTVYSLVPRATKQTRKKDKTEAAVFVVLKDV